MHPLLKLLAIALFGSATLPAQTRVAITFDDLPAHSSLPPGETRLAVATKIIAALQGAHTPPIYGFVNAASLQTQPDTVRVLEAWRAAGFPLANHTWSHMDLNKSTAEQWEADLLRNEPTLTQQMAGADWHWLRFPFLSEGETPAKQSAVRSFLHDHGYRIAGVTMSFGDYAYNAPFARCSAQHNDAAIATLESAYLAAAEQALSDAQQMSQTLEHREIPLVLLMHIGAFDARMLPRLLAMYKAHGVQFITLEQAERDPFYTADTDLTAPWATDSLEARLRAKHLPVPQHTGVPVNPEILCPAGDTAAR